MKYIAIILLPMVLSGCGETRNNPAKQAEDYKICADAGMSAYLNYYGEVKCTPKWSVEQ